MSFDLKALLDRELFENLITKHHLSLRLISFLTTAAGKEQPTLIWLALESQDLAKDLLALLDVEATYFDHYRHPMPVTGSKVPLFGCDGIPVPTAGAARARLSRIVSAPQGAVELLLDLFAPGEQITCLTACRAFYDALLARGIQPADVGKRFARPAAGAAPAADGPAPLQEDQAVTSEPAAAPAEPAPA